MKKGRSVALHAAMLRGTAGDFWAVVGPDRSPVQPYAWSREEFEMKLALLGMELTGRETAPEEAGLPAGFCADYRIRTFEIGEAGGGRSRAGPGPGAA